ncbi:nucleotidyl transferase AbiEii/AbiGii toxin family protein [Rhodobacteraceae bacterium]|nr:nucleotidyl transferase AbiEii/AbiGii toxin family protein [Paracoccaceae bacterium]
MTYFGLSVSDKIDALEAAATSLGRPADLLEKDIWVVWALDALFDSPIGEHLVFKGGTSLSKAYRAIDRFSEDVDLTYDIREIIPELIDDPDNPYPSSRSQARKWTDIVRARLAEWIENQPFQILSGKIEEVGVDAKLKLEDDNIVLEYEAVRNGTGYVRPAVLLEFGARSTGEPAEHRKIVCDISEALPDLLTPIAHPRVMRAERTFWEKATAIHAYCLRGAFRGGDRYARHWYDLDCLDRAGIAATAISDRSLALDVGTHKRHFFRENDKLGNVIDYAKAVSGSLSLIPSGEARKALAHDYQQMIDAGLLQVDAVNFELMMDRLSILQERINSGSTK